MSEGFIKGIIGDGFLTEVILTAFTRQIGGSFSDTYVYCKTSRRCQELLEQYNVRAVQNPMVFVPPAKILILAIELEEANQLLPQITDKVADDVILISVVQGLKIAEIEKYFPGKAVIRLILNPWIISGVGVSSYFVGSVRSEETANIAKALLLSMGEIVEADSEKELETIGDLITGETMYAYITINALIEGGINAGLPLEKSKEIATSIFGSTSSTFNDSNDIAKYVLERGYKKTDYLKQGKEILDKYNVMTNLQKSFVEHSEAKNIFKFRYRW